MNVLEALTNHYNSYDEDARLLSQHGQVEFLTTVRYVEKYLFPHARILEIGAGTGRYSHYFAQMGYRVDALELIPHNIDIFRQNTKGNEPVTICQGNATDLSIFDNDVYDITLLLGPMYHLFTEKDKLQALSEAIRVTRRDGIIFAAYCMADASILQAGFLKGRVKELIERKMLNPETFQAHSEPEDVFELHRKSDIDRLRNHFPVKQLHYVSADGYANYMRDNLVSMDEETYQQFLNYHFATCELPELTGYSNHTIDIFRKE